MPVPPEHWQPLRGQAAVLAPRRARAQRQILALPRLLPPAQTRPPVRAQRRTYRLEPVPPAEVAIVRRTRRAAEQ
jgi:hypothetical protein